MMMEGGPGGQIPTSTVHAHAGIEEALDRAYIGAVVNSAKARTYMHSPRGPIHDVFLNFYTPFVALVEYTYQLEALKMEESDPTKNLRDALLKWIDSGDGEHLTQEQILVNLKVGLRLFRDYKGLLMKRGIISVSRR